MTLRKTSVFLISLVLACQVGYSQNESAPLSKGDILIEAYLGWPNFLTTIVRIATAGDNQFSSQGSGPYGGRVLYQIDDKVSIGGEFNYANSLITWSETNLNQFNVPVTYDYNIEVPRMRFLARVDYTFVSDGNFLPYATGALGFNYTRFRFSTNDPNVIIDEYDLPNLVPVGYRIGLGVRGFLASFLAMHAELGIGGPLISGGLTLKI